MGELILCKENTAAVPFFLEEGALNVYSVEELSYYIENNVLFLNVDFMSVELINWIDHQLHMDELARGLRNLLAEGASMDQFLELILTEGGYCSNVEIKNVLLAARSIATKSREEMQKIRGDRMLSKGNVLGAVYVYRKIFSDGDLRKFTSADLAAVWHNLGCAHARLFQFKEAATCFERAFSYGHRHESKRQMMFAVLCSGDDGLIEETAKRNEISPEEVKRFEWEVTEAKKDVPDTRTLDRERTKELVEDWKNSYRYMSSV